jgi:hypothetical protein
MCRWLSPGSLFRLRSSVHDIDDTDTCHGYLIQVQPTSTGAAEFVRRPEFAGCAMY